MPFFNDLHLWIFGRAGRMAPGDLMNTRQSLCQIVRAFEARYIRRTGKHETPGLQSSGKRISDQQGIGAKVVHCVSNSSKCSPSFC